MLSFLSRPNAESKSDPPTPRSLTPRADESRRSKIKGLFFVELTWNAFCGSHHHCEASEKLNAPYVFDLGAVRTNSQRSSTLFLAGRASMPMYVVARNMFLPRPRVFLSGRARVVGHVTRRSLRPFLLRGFALLLRSWTPCDCIASISPMGSL